MLEHIYVTQKRINRRLLELELGFALELGFELRLGSVLELELELGLGNWKGNWTKGRINTPLMTA